METIEPYIEEIAECAAKGAYIEPYERGAMLRFDWDDAETGISVYGEAYCYAAGWQTYGDGYDTPYGYALVNPDAIIEKLDISGIDCPDSEIDLLCDCIREQIRQTLLDQ